MEYIKKLFKDKKIEEQYEIIKNQNENIKNISIEDIEKYILTINQKNNNLLNFNNTFYRDLEIFDTYDSNISNLNVYNTLNSKYTLGAQHLLKYILANPISDTEHLINRKKSIDDLGLLLENNNDDSLDKNIITSLQILKEKESTLYWFLNSSNTDFESMKHMLYFPKILFFMNKFGAGLSLKNIYKIFLSPLYGILSPLTYFIIPYCILRFKFKLQIGFKKYVYEIVRTFITMYKALNKKLLNPNTLWIGFSCLIYFQNIITSFDLSRLYNQLTDFIIDKIDDLALYVQHTKNISNLIYKEQYIKHFFNFKENIKYNEKLLNSKKYYFKYFANFGEKLNMYKNLDKQLINDMLVQSYSCDAIFNIYYLKKKYTMVIPDYLTNNGNNPQLKINNFYHPLVNNEKKITNSAFITNTKNMIITGPNAAGKSTFIKSIAVNALLAQTICICFAKKIIITPFSYIASQINTYDINGQKSLFQAEMYNIKSILDDIKLHSANNTNSIVFLDELFNSTNIVEGVAASYAICDKLSQFKSNLNIFATHFVYLCKLSKNKKYINYKFEANCSNENNTTTLTFPYKIKKGISSQYIALEILKMNKFDDDIIDDSIVIRNNIMNIKS
jgi:DNA mismatch repair ATPase MutS